MQRTVKKLQALDQRIQSIQDQSSAERDQYIDEAEKASRDLDRQIEAIINRHELEDPDFAEAHGLSLSHFRMDAGPQAGDWMLLASNWGPGSRSITETDSTKLTSLHQRSLKEFCGGNLPPVVAFKRRKTVLEVSFSACQPSRDIMTSITTLCTSADYLRLLGRCKERLSKRLVTQECWSRISR